MTQTEIPAPFVALPHPKRCDWCGNPGRPYEVAPARLGVEKRTRAKVPKKPAITATACTPCAARLDAAKEKA